MVAAFWGLMWDGGVEAWRARSIRAAGTGHDIVDRDAESDADRPSAHVPFFMFPLKQNLKSPPPLPSPARSRRSSAIVNIGSFHVPT